MSKALRYLRIAFSATCLIVVVLLCALWVRSCWRADTIVRISSERIINLLSTNGVLYVYYDGNLHFLTPYKGDTAWHYSMSRKPTNPPPGNMIADGRVTLLIPYWLTLVFVAAVTAAPWIRWRFTLRTLLLVTTIIAILLGVFMWSVT